MLLCKFDFAHNKLSLGWHVDKVFS